MVLFDYAIVLGSTVTEIYKNGVGVVLKEPSLIAVSHEGKRKVLKSVGTDARTYVGTSADIDVFEPIVEGVILNKQLTAIMLREFLKRVHAGKFSGIKVAFAVPVGTSTKDRNALLDLAYGLNFHTVALVPSVLADLVGMGADITQPNSHLIVNIGGGVSDVAIVTKGNIVRGGSVTISGKSLKNVVDTHLREQHSIMVTEQTRSDILKELISLYENDRNQLTIDGLDVDKKTPKKVVLSTEELYPIATFFFTELVSCVDTLLHMSSSEVIADVAKYGILVSGELCGTTGLETYLREHLEYPVYIDSDKNATIYGLGELIENKTLFDLAVSNFK